MLVQLGRANYNEFSWWDKFKMAFLPTHIEHVKEEWTYIYWKQYKSCKVIIAMERYH